MSGNNKVPWQHLLQAFVFLRELSVGDCKLLVVLCHRTAALLHVLHRFPLASLLAECRAWSYLCFGDNTTTSALLTVKGEDAQKTYPRSTLGVDRRCISLPRKVRQCHQCSMHVNL